MTDRPPKKSKRKLLLRLQWRPKIAECREEDQLLEQPTTEQGPGHIDRQSNGAQGHEEATGTAPDANRPHTCVDGIRKRSERCYCGASQRRLECSPIQVGVEKSCAFANLPNSAQKLYLDRVRFRNCAPKSYDDPKRPTADGMGNHNPTCMLRAQSQCLTFCLPFRYVAHCRHMSSPTISDC